MVLLTTAVLLRVLFLLFLANSASAAGAGGEWYQECNDGNCGYNRDVDTTTKKSNCLDAQDDCVKYARMGECFANPDWMHDRCQRSCGWCQDDGYSDNDNDEESCTDKHSSCEKWADEMECYVNPAYMAGACPASCGLCVNVKDLRSRGVSEEEITRRKQFVETDFGLWQSIPKDDQDNAVRMRVRKMGKYIHNQLNHLGRKSVCNNQYHECAKWASDNDCERKIDFMISHCSLVCEYCHVVEQYHTCRQQDTKENSVQPFRDLVMVRNHLIQRKGGVNLVKDSCSADQPKSNSRSNDSDSDNDEWVISLEWSSLWSDTFEDFDASSRTELALLLKAKEEIEWMDATDRKDPAAVTYDGSSFPDRSGGTLGTWSKFSLEPQFQSFLSQISNLLHVPEANLEVEFVRYHRRGERHASHHDFRVHDSWKHSGGRVLSVCIVLQRPNKGGSYGFPSLEWLLIEDPQILIWPNVKEVDSKLIALKRMENEQLPVVDGELYAVHVWVHEYPFDPDNNKCSCFLGLDLADE